MFNGAISDGVGLVIGAVLGGGFVHIVHWFRMAHAGPRGKVKAVDRACFKLLQNIDERLKSVEAQLTLEHPPNQKGQRRA